ncbi:hypothetical protein KIPB_016815, partial [Kipferlia bialata]|eukprot:g16815.t1
MNGSLLTPGPDLPPSNPLARPGLEAMPMNMSAPGSPQEIDAAELTLDSATDMLLAPFKMERLL